MNKDNKEMRDLCIKQGYVPSDCTLDGMIVFYLTQDGKNPCVGCNANCPHTQIDYSSEKYTELQNQYNQEREKRKKEEQKLEKRINKREISGGNSNNGLMFVDTDITYQGVYHGKPQISVMVMKPLQERMYIRRFTNADIAASYIPSICRKYDVQQIYIDTGGYGYVVSDILFSRFGSDKELDIIPMRVSGMDLGMNLK